MGSLAGKIAVITGGNSGIGKATARLFAHGKAPITVGGGKLFGIARMTYQFQKIGPSRRVDFAREIALDIDEHGSPVTLEATSWFVCFVPALKRQWWHGFVHKRHKHVFAMRPEPNGMWTLFEPWWHRLLTASITADQARKFLAWAAAGDVLLVRESIPGSGSQISGWANCAVLVSFLLGRGCRAWTPHGFYRRLTREPGVRSIDVSMLLALDADALAWASVSIAARDWYPKRPYCPWRYSDGRPGDESRRRRLSHQAGPGPDFA